MLTLERSLQHFKLLSRARPQLVIGLAAGEELSVQNCSLDQMRLLAIECLAAIKHVEDELEKQEEEGISKLQRAQSKVFWLGMQEVGKQCHLDVCTPKQEGRAKERTACSCLLQSFPNSKKVRNDQGPLYLGWAAISDGIEEEDVRTIANANPAMVKKGIFSAKINVCHLAAMKRNPNLQIIQLFEVYFPFFAKTADDNDWLPIHFAARFSDSKNMIEYLFNAIHLPPRS